MTQLVIDANVLGDVCRDEDNAREVLDIVRERKLTVIFCKEISNEYTPYSNILTVKDIKKYFKTGIRS